MEGENPEKLGVLIEKAEHHQQTLLEISSLLINLMSQGSDDSNDSSLTPFDLQVLEDVLESLESLRSQLLKVIFDLKEAIPVVKQGVLEFDLDQMCYLRMIGISWTEIASLFGISRMSLYQKRKEAGIVDDFKYTNISDDDLEHEVKDIKSEMPNVGEKIIAGVLRARNIFVQRRRIRQAIHAVDPINTALRWHKKINRRIYSVPGPMSLWHIG